MPRNPNVNRRGLAMLLVLVGLMIGTILATAYLASRDNSAAIGENIAAAARARWGAASALELGIAIMQTQTDWRTSHINGKLLDDYSFLAEATIDLDIIDLQTALPPTAESEYIQLTATATVDGLQQTAIAIAHVSAAPGGAVSVDLSEFAIFASERIRLQDMATVTRWPTAPLSDLGKRIAFGTQGTSASTVEIYGAATTIDTTLYHGPGSSEALVQINNDTIVEQVSLQDQIPVPAPPSPSALPPDGVTTYPDLLINTATTIAANDRRNNIEILTSAGIATLQGDIVVVAENDLLLYPGSALIIDGNVELDVFGDLTMDSASIELKPNATLTIYLRDDVNLNYSYIGDERVDDLRDSSGYASWMDPERIRFFTRPLPAEGDDDATLSQDWRLNNNSIIKGSLYSAHARIEIETDSAIYGRVAVTRLLIKDNGSLFYDHTLDSGLGYMNLDGPLYDVNEHIFDEFLGLASLDEADLLAASDATGTVIYSSGNTYGTPPSEEIPPVPPGEPTPRPVPVEYEIVSFGTDMRDWEKQN
ncbi:MAG: hypothetical protein O6758_00275 [Planctomycetota bacterium]|nr:hypothetical protein [Planctomycetota bacterium]